MLDTGNPSAIRSQTEITQALISLMNSYPYSEISVKQITLEAKLSRKTFYRNYESKDDVLFSLIRKTLHSYYDVINNTEGDVLKTIFAFAGKNKDLLLLLDKNNMLHVVLQCLNDYEPLSRRKIVTGTNPFNKMFEGLDPVYIMAMIIGAFWNIIASWIHRGMDTPPDEIITTITAYFHRMEVNVHHVV